jgi:hypothetical protein
VTNGDSSERAVTFLKDIPICKCPPNYFGTTIDGLTGCYYCPGNAVQPCGGDNGTTFTCLEDYFKDGDYECTLCWGHSASKQMGKAPQGSVGVQSCYIVGGADSLGTFEFVSEDGRCYYGVE